MEDVWWWFKNMHEMSFYIFVILELGINTMKCMERFKYMLLFYLIYFFFLISRIICNLYQYIQQML
jgi:hypothetical protein